MNGLCYHPDCGKELKLVIGETVTTCGNCGHTSDNSMARERMSRWIDSLRTSPTPGPIMDAAGVKTAFDAVSTYPDGNPKSAQGAKKFDLMYLPLPARIAVNQALEDGAKKYGKANWRQTGVSASVYLNAAARHIDQYNEGQELASDSGVHNLGHAMACLAIIIDAAANGKLMDDRPLACVDTDALLLRSRP